MPEISVDLPKTKYGYTVQAEEVFWVRQGILRSTDLRDSLDEQVIADVAACILSEKPVERSKDTLERQLKPSRDGNCAHQFGKLFDTLFGLLKVRYRKRLLGAALRSS